MVNRYIHTPDRIQSEMRIEKWEQKPTKWIKIHFYTSENEIYFWQMNKNVKLWLRNRDSILGTQYTILQPHQHIDLLNIHFFLSSSEGKKRVQNNGKKKMK